MSSSVLDAGKLGQFVNAKWDDEIVPQLVDYIAIPNKMCIRDMRLWPPTRRGTASRRCAAAV